MSSFSQVKVGKIGGRGSHVFVRALVIAHHAVQIFLVKGVSACHHMVWQGLAQSFGISARNGHSGRRQVSTMNSRHQTTLTTTLQVHAAQEFSRPVDAFGRVVLVDRISTRRIQHVRRLASSQTLHPFCLCLAKSVCARQKSGRNLTKSGKICICPAASASMAI